MAHSDTETALLAAANADAKPAVPPEALVEFLRRVGIDHGFVAPGVPMPTVPLNTLSLVL